MLLRRLPSALVATAPQPPDESRWANVRNPATAADRQAYEQDCLEYTRWLLPKESDAQIDRHELLQAELEGEYPETVISVRWRDRYYGEEHIDIYPIWSPVLRRTTAVAKCRTKSLSLSRHGWASVSRSLRRRRGRVRTTV